jgi:cytochrome o ubiquinol oxidase subunit 2
MNNKKFTCAGVSLLIATTLLSGCSSIVLFDPKGPVGEAERYLIIAAIGLMLIVVIPVYIMAVWFPLKYRASNSGSPYMPKWGHSGLIEFFMWAVPFAIVFVLSVLAWKTTHSLDPYKPIDSSKAPVNVEVVSLDWKWLFIYPNHNIATVNELVFPVDTPVSFKLTSDTVMSSFFIPQLGSQIYTMGGMQTKLHLLAHTQGIYTGQNQQFSGRGYSDMHFKTHVVSAEDFESWVQKVRQSEVKLDTASYDKIAHPSVGTPITYYASVQPGLFVDVIRKFEPNWAEHTQHANKDHVSGHKSPDHSEKPSDHSGTHSTDHSGTHSTDHSDTHSTDHSEAH